MSELVKNNDGGFTYYELYLTDINGECVFKGSTDELIERLTKPDHSELIKKIEFRLAELKDCYWLTPEINLFIEAIKALKGESDE